MIKTLKKFSKKSLAILIALLMIISVMPFTPTISVEAANADETPSVTAELVKTNIGNVKKSYSFVTDYNAGTDYMKGIIRAGTWTDSTNLTIQYNSSNADNKIDMKVVGASNIVGLYTGNESDIRFPLVAQYTFGADQTAVKNYIGYDHISLSTSGTNFGMGVSTWKSCSDWDNLTDVTDSAFTNYDFSSDIKNDVGRTTSGKDYTSNRFKTTDKKKRYWKSSLKYNGNFSNGSYYDKIQSPSFELQADYSWSYYKVIDGTQYVYSTNRKDTLSTSLNLYVLNIKPLLDIINSSDFESHFNTIYNNLWMYDSTKREAYFTAMNNIISFNLDNESLTNESDVIAVANKIEKLVDDYNTTKNVPIKTITVSFNMGDGNIITKSIKAGQKVGVVTLPTNTSKTKIQGEDKHNVFSWQDGISDIIPHYEEDAIFYEIATPEACTGGTATCTDAPICEECKSSYSTALGHNYTSVVTAPTCTEQGYTTYTCSRCNDTYVTGYVPAKNHTEAAPVEENRHEATCTEDGSYDSVVYCTVCKEELSRETKTIKKLGHSFTKYTQTVAPTCTTVGTETATCDRCDVTNTRDVAIDESAHNWGNWVDDKNGSTHTRVCTYNDAHKEQQDHEKNGSTCSKCGYVAKVMITFVDENDGVISSAEYNIGADVVVPELPEQTEVYVGDSQHKVTTYSWNEIPQATASQAATYKRVKTESTVDCSNELKQQGETSDTWYCTVCGHEYERTVTDMSALKANITALETAVNVDDAAYKYEATALEAAKKKLDEAKAYVANDNNRYASIENVNAMSTSVGTAYTELTVNGLAKYSQTFIIKKDDGNGNTTDLATFTEGYENLAYGSTVEFSDYTIPTIEDESSTLNGLPMYAVYKWVKIVNGAEEKLGTTDVQISDVVKGETTYICYVLDFKATDETQNTTRVRYLDKSGNTIKFDTATVGEPYTRKDTSIAPLIPYYNCTGWELVFGDETTVGTRELVYRAVYTFNETEANRCTIVGLDGVYVNGTTGTPGYTAYYDEKIELTGADKYAYANADGSIIAPINENYIFAPHLNGVDKTIYITKVETPITEAKSIVTGVFTTHEDPTYNYLVINAQYYLPEGAKAVEAGAVIGKYNSADTLKIGSAVKVVSDTQGNNHEYSLQMSYSKGKTGTLYARSYLIYVDSNGDTQTVYSDIAECVLN